MTIFFFHVLSKSDYLNFASATAFSQSRVQAFLNMPLILWVHSLSDYFIYDLLNIGAFFTLCVLMTLYMSKILGLQNALILMSANLFLFPLHYYFTFPQGYPLMAMWPLIFGFISALGFFQSLESNKLGLRLLPLILFFFSLFGPEYNFILHPVSIIVILFIKEKSLLRKDVIVKLTPYFFIWVIAFGIYLGFSQYARTFEVNKFGRVSMGFNIVDFANTFLKLQEKSFLPLALFNGIALGDSSEELGIILPPVISYYHLFKSKFELFSLCSIFLISCLFFGYLFLIFKAKRVNYRAALVFLILFISIPCAVVSLSSHYQKIVLLGYLQGHLVTFYSVFGFNAMIFMVMGILLNLAGKNRIVFLMLTILFSMFSTLTFVYNNINRQVMMANKQKWESFSNFLEYVSSERNELKDEVIFAKNYWNAIGVSAIPVENKLIGGNYWSQYSKLIYDVPLKMVDKEEIVTKYKLNYFANGDGNPVTVFLERKTEENLSKLILISKLPIQGIVKIQDNKKDINIDEWKCGNICTVELTVPEQDIHSTQFSKINTSRPSLIEQYFLPRGLSFARPLDLS